MRTADLGIDTRLYSALAVIAEQSDPSQQAVAKALGSDRATVVTLVDELQQRGWSGVCPIRATVGRTHFGSRRPADAC